MINLPTLLIILAIACPAAIAAYVAICNSLDRGILYQLRLMRDKMEFAQRQAPVVVIRDEPVMDADRAKAILDAAFQPRDARGRFQSRQAFVTAALAAGKGK